MEGVIGKDVVTKKKRKTVLIVSFSAIGAIVAIVIFAFLNGYAYAGIKSPNERVGVAYRICDETMVTAYNKLEFPLDDADQATMDSMIKRIDDTRESDQDATCQAIRFSVALYDGDMEVMQSSVKNIEDVHKKGIFVDNNLDNNYSIGLMKNIIKEQQANRDL